jgi:hypothetical protein
MDQQIDRFPAVDGNGLLRGREIMADQVFIDQQQLLEANDSHALGIADLLARHNVEKRERTREKLFSEIDDSVSALMRLVGFPASPREPSTSRRR